MSAIFDAAVAQYRAMRESYDEAVAAQYDAAMTDTNGYMVNRPGLAAGIESAELFRGSASRAYKYASDELVEFWQQTPRLSLAAYERAWLRSQEEEHESYRAYGWAAHDYVSRETEQD